MVSRTFEASLRSSSFWTAVVVPPTVYWILVQLFAAYASEAASPLPGFLMIVLLANGLPLAALGWMLCSVAAYTIEPGRLIVHRVVSDREFVFGVKTDIVQARNGEIAVRCERGTLRLRVTEPALCLEHLRSAAASGRV